MRADAHTSTHKVNSQRTSLLLPSLFAILFLKDRTIHNMLLVHIAHFVKRHSLKSNGTTADAGGSTPPSPPFPQSIGDYAVRG
jgi:hypothetical protein